MWACDMDACCLSGLVSLQRPPWDVRKYRSYLSGCCHVLLLSVEYVKTLKNLFKSSATLGDLAPKGAAPLPPLLRFC